MTDKDKTYSTSATLLCRVKNQYDEESWEEFVEAYNPYIYSLCGKLGVKLQDRDDVVQKTLLGLWKKLPEFEYDPDYSRFRTWLSKVIRFQVYAYFSKSNSEQNKKNKLLELEEENTPNALHEVIENEWKVFISNKAWDNIKEDFTEKTQTLFLMRSKGDSPQKVADTIGIEVSTVYVHKK